MGNHSCQSHGIRALDQDGVAAGQADGSVREGDPTLLARSVLLAAHGFTLSAETMTDSRRSLAAYDEELRVLLERYLAR